MQSLLGHIRILFLRCLNLGGQVIVWLPIKQEEFSATNQSKFVSALATASGTSIGWIEIESIAKSRRFYRRTEDSIAATGLVITADIVAESPQQADVLAALLTPASLSSALTREQLPSAILRSVSVVGSVTAEVSQKLYTAISVSMAIFMMATLLVVTLWRRRLRRLRRRVNRRLIGAKSGTVADISDLPLELRGKYEPVRVLGCGAFGVVIEAWQLNNGRRSVQRAVKIVHSRGKNFTETEARRLEREVIPNSKRSFSYLFSI